VFNHYIIILLNISAFGKRIQEIMKFYHVSASGFADAMGVGRSSISHILSGRNKPSLDFVMKITEAYPEAELYWLLYGQGAFPKSEKKPIVEKTAPQISTSTSTLTEIPEDITSDQDLFSIPESEIEKIDTIPTETSNIVNEKVVTSISSGKEINQIVFFYKDGTFDSYKN